LRNQSHRKVSDGSSFTRFGELETSSGPKRKPGRRYTRVASHSNAASCSNHEPVCLISFKNHQAITATMPTLNQPYILSNRRNGSPYRCRRTAHLFWHPLTFDRNRIRLVLHGILSSEILMPLRQAPRFFKGHTLRSAPLSPWTPYSYGDAQIAQLFGG
jgi:hypothetical protein